MGIKIDLDELVPGTKHFRWSELLHLPLWGIHVFPTSVQYLHLIDLCKKLEKIRHYLGKPMIITSGLRPSAYNERIGGAPYSAHRQGMAVDFKCAYMPSDEIREILKPLIDDLRIRIEDLPGSSWVHVDLRYTSKGNNYFKP